MSTVFNLLPYTFDDDEKIVRTIFHPMNIKESGNGFNKNAFTPPKEIDEISVNRLSHNTVTKCKRFLRLFKILN